MLSRRYPSVAATLVALSVLFSHPAPARSAEDEPARSRRASDLKVATIPVEGMVCLSCAASIKRAVRKVEGVSDAEVDFPNRALRVTYASERSLLLSRVRTAIAGLGYKPGSPVVAP